jgi:hypothetical protein
MITERQRAVLLVASVALAGCEGLVGDPSGVVDGEPPAMVPEDVPPLTHAAGLGPIGVRRLTRAELRQTLLDLTGIDPGVDIEFLPADSITPFDNDYTLQAPSAALVEALNAIAARTAASVVEDEAARARVLGCTPTGAGDETCLRSFIERFGRRAMRRPLTTEEVDGLASLGRFATEEDDFYVAVALVLRTLLQDMELVYRIEIGESMADGVVRLTPYELAARLSYFLWGSSPDDRLLDAARDGELADAAGVRSIATEMLDDERASDRVERFHALWLGYEVIRHPAELARSMRMESDALVNRVVFERGSSWYDLFTSEEAYVDDTLAEIYGLPLPGSPSWVAQPERRGLLASAAFLSGGVKFGDTSPVLRGILVRERLFCQPILPPPPTVNVDDPPGEENPDACKEERYAQHRSGGCAVCHDAIDPVGFGLEAYDSTGRFRTHEIDRPDCAISGDGAVTDLDTTFNGPSELADIVVGSGALGECFAQHLEQFTIGRELEAIDRRTVAEIGARFEANGFDLRTLLVELAASEAFRFRVVDESTEEVSP